MIPFPETPGGWEFVLEDPAWRFATRSAKGRDRCPDALLPNETRAEQRSNSAERHYKTMTLEEMKALPIMDVVAKNVTFGMWTIDTMIPQALELAAYRGLTFKTVLFYWVKTIKQGRSMKRLIMGDEEERLFPMGTGYYSRANPEQCLLFTKGKPLKVKDHSVRRLIVAPRREHSRKPDQQYERIDRLFGTEVRRLEMNCRRPQPGWAVWGDQIEPDFKLEAA